MKIEKAHIDHINTQFAEMQTKEDLAKLLSDAKNFLYGEECKPIKLKALTYYANPEICKKRYKTFTVKKKSGADRTIHAPVKGLKSICRALNFVLQCLYEPHQAATGFVMDKSIVDNAKKHVGNHYVYNLDLKDFFHSFDLYRVKFGLLNEIWGIYNLKKYRQAHKADFKTKDSLAFLIACLTTHPFKVEDEIKTLLPQGSPASPTLTNILCKKLDRRLQGLAKRFNLNYSRYADDITFSSMHNVYQDESEFLKELQRIIKDQNFEIKASKTRLQKSDFRQEVTGLKVNHKVNVNKRYIKQLRMWLYYWEKYGYEKAKEIFKRDYLADKGHVKNMKNRFVNVLSGKLEYLKMVKGENDGTYRKLNQRFEKLLPKNSSIDKILDIWGNNNIENAIKEFDALNGNTESYKPLKSYFELTGSHEFVLKGNSILLYDITGKLMTTILIPKKLENKVNTKSIDEAFKDDVLEHNFCVAINGYDNKNWLYISKTIRLKSEDFL